MLGEGRDILQKLGDFANIHILHNQVIKCIRVVHSLVDAGRS